MKKKLIYLGNILSSWGLMFKKLGKAVGEGVKETIAIALISLGVNMIGDGRVIEGGALVAVGWILLVVNRYLIR